MLNNKYQNNMKKMENNAKTRYEIAEEYGVCTKTFNKWLIKNKINIGPGLITPKEQEIIYSKLCFPKNS